MIELVTIKTKDNTFVLTTKPTKNNEIKQYNINHIIKSIKEIEKTTSKLNTLIIAIKTNQLLYLHNPDYANSKDNILLSKSLLNDCCLFDLTDCFFGGLFNDLKKYSLINLLNIMNIPKVQSFMLINSLCMCNDQREHINYVVYFDNQPKRQLKYIQKLVITEIFSMNIYLRYLFSNRKNNQDIFLYLLSNLE